MLKQVIAQMKQNSGMMTQFMQGNAALAGVNVQQQQAMFEVFKDQETAKDQVRTMVGYWYRD